MQFYDLLSKYLLKMLINTEKAHVLVLLPEGFDFLECTFGRCFSRETGKNHIATGPSRRSIKRMVAKITVEPDRSRCLPDIETVATRLNRQLSRWANYFTLGLVGPVYRVINYPAEQHLRSWLYEKQKVQGKGNGDFPTHAFIKNWAWSIFHQEHTVFRGRRHDVLSESPLRKIRTVGPMSGMWKRGFGYRATSRPYRRH